MKNLVITVDDSNYTASKTVKIAINKEKTKIAAKNKQKQRLRKVKNKIHENRRRHRKELIEDSTKRVEIEKHDNIENVEPMQKEELDKKETKT